MNNLVDSIISKMILYFGKDVRRINHALKVYSLAKNIGAIEGLSGEEKIILDAAAVLHDIGIKESEKKYNTSMGKYQEIEGPAVARELLKEYNLDEKLLERICYLIGNHHTYTKIDGLDFQILVEADFLVNIFEDNMDKKQITTVKEKYFKTKTGIDYVNSVYLDSI
ncbi:HD domain-containing protein [Clostridium sp. DJ247]|uniref:HD domain-containing protein n=1 Tax=Clostridium sp. DJ247 TaxID=2726188 RepID=UPI001628701F|nr:HD domain-containing protein [Clostridium sp. DJ247]MBC2582354.1 HD domain-containing protein [Clostridium sp. DJ247]